MRNLLFFSFILFLFACNQGNTPTTTNAAKDEHSCARPSEAIVKHLDLDISVDFTQKKLAGTATLSIENHHAKQIWLDTKDLTIKEITISDGKTKTPAKFQLGKRDSILGSPLSVDIEENTNSVAIQYETSPSAEALQWLNPQQTAGKTQPYLFTQSQAILARTWVPIQDGPAIRFTYNATVRVPKDLMAVMSASNPQQKNAEGIYKFEMKQPIPAYLLALAVGDIAFKATSERVGIYSEPSVLEKYSWELAETEKMVQLAESLYGKYAWERYDILVLPPSFPFGGMENPRLTFATPTIITGDRSLVTLVAHELAHSWSGNLVTNTTWDDFWLNEGFTVYFELRIMEALKGRDYSEMLAQLNYEEMLEEMKELKPEDTHLKLNLKGRNPDDGVTDIAYIKGCSFLRLLEETVGREKWDAFLKSYFTENAFKSMTTEQFLERLKPLLSEEQAKKVNIEAWVYGAGLPENFPKPNPIKLIAVDKQIEKANGKFASLETKNWSTHEWIHCFTALPKNLTAAQMQEMDAAFNLTKSQNAEIQFPWYKLAIEHQYTAAYPAMENFLISVGRRKFLSPLYKAMCQTEEGKAMARKIYEKAKPNYHPICVTTIDDILK